MTQQRLPHWFKVRIKHSENFRRIDSLVKELHLHTVCKEAGCPNKWECWNRGTVTFIILGDICTRRCRFCNVNKGNPSGIDWKEAKSIAEAVNFLDLKHAVITSVTRDDLKDGGAALFARAVEEVRDVNPECRIELLVPDFKGMPEAVYRVVDSAPTVLGHNLETVCRLYPEVRPQADYRRSIDLLYLVKRRNSNITTKSGLILGFGERIEEIIQTMKDLSEVGCDILTMGQYLRPSKKHVPVKRFYTPEEFQELERTGIKMGFLSVKADPLVRSSYHADEVYVLRKA